MAMMGTADTTVMAARKHRERLNCRYPSLWRNRLARGKYSWLIHEHILSRVFDFLCECLVGISIFPKHTTHIFFPAIVYRLSIYPLTPPILTVTKYFWRNGYTIKIGTVATTVIAALNEFGVTMLLVCIEEAR